MPQTMNSLIQGLQAGLQLGESVSRGIQRRSQAQIEGELMREEQERQDRLDALAEEFQRGQHERAERRDTRQEEKHDALMREFELEHQRQAFESSVPGQILRRIEDWQQERAAMREAEAKDPTARQLREVENRTRGMQALRARLETEQDPLERELIQNQIDLLEFKNNADLGQVEKGKDPTVKTYNYEFEGRRVPVDMTPEQNRQFTRFYADESLTDGEKVEVLSQILEGKEPRVSERDPDRPQVRESRVQELQEEIDRLQTQVDDGNRYVGPELARGGFIPAADRKARLEDRQETLLRHLRSPEEVRAAFQAGRVTREQARERLRDFVEQRGGEE